MEFFKVLWNDIMEIAGERIQLGTNPTTTLNIIVWSIFFGFIIAILAVIYNKLIIGSIVRKLHKKKANSEDSAVTASEAGCNGKFSKFILREKGSVRKVIFCTDDDCDFEKKKFYIPDSAERKAEFMYGKSDLKISNVVLAIVVLILLAFAALIFVPDLIQMLNNFISGL